MPFDFSQFTSYQSAIPVSEVILPDPLIIGDTWSFQIPAGPYGDGTFTASITFAALASKLTAAATLNDGLFQWVIHSSQTSLLSPQPYMFNINITDNMGNRITIQRGATQVSADITASGGAVSNMTNLQLMLAAADATLIALMGQKTSMVMFQGQAYHFQDIEKLWNVRNYIAAQVADEMAALSGNLRGRKIVVVFTNV